VIARQISKELLMMFKRSTLTSLVDEGALRRPLDFSIDTHFLPQLYGQIVFDLSNHSEHIENIDSLLSYCMRTSAKQHRDAMVKEYKRKEEKKKEELRLQREKEEAKRKRKEERAAARERFRIQQLLERVQSSIINPSSLEEYNPQIKVYDVRDPNGKKDGVFLIGGFIGELIITFTCLLDYILANPQNQNFQFTQEGVETFLRDLLVHENFADGILTLHLARDPTLKVQSGRESKMQGDDEEPERIEMDDEAFLKFCLTKTNISDYGLGFFFDVLKDLVISKEYIEVLYRVIIKAARTKLKPLIPVPEMPGPDAEGNEPTDEAKDVATKQINEVMKNNAELEKFNEDVVKFQSKVKIAYRPQNESTGRNEVGMMRVSNWREPVSSEVDLTQVIDGNTSALG
jgi:hypothetical protein